MDTGLLQRTHVALAGCLGLQRLFVFVSLPVRAVIRVWICYLLEFLPNVILHVQPGTYVRYAADVLSITITSCAQNTFNYRLVVCVAAPNRRCSSTSTQTSSAGKYAIREVTRKVNMCVRIRPIKVCDKLSELCYLMKGKAVWIGNNLKENLFVSNQKTDILSKL